MVVSGGAPMALWSAGRGRERLQPRERGGKLSGPRPVFAETQPPPPGVAADRCGLVQQAVAQPFELPSAGVVGEAQLPGPGEDVLREPNQPQPCLVVLKALEREAAQPAVLALADVILDVRVSAMGQIELRDAVVGLVGEEHREPVAVVVSEGLLIAVLELGAPRESAAIATSTPTGRHRR